jgi:hypothetical protein
MLVGIALVLVAIVFAFFFFGGALRPQTQQPSGPNIQVPSKIDVKVDAPAQPAPAKP